MPAFKSYHGPAGGVSWLCTAAKSPSWLTCQIDPGRPPTPATIVHDDVMSIERSHHARTAVVIIVYGVRGINDIVAMVLYKQADPPTSAQTRRGAIVVGTAHSRGTQRMELSGGGSA